MKWHKLAKHLFARSLVCAGAIALLAGSNYANAAANDITVTSFTADRQDLPGSTNIAFTVTLQKNRADALLGLGQQYTAKVAGVTAAGWSYVSASGQDIPDIRPGASSTVQPFNFQYINMPGNNPIVYTFTLKTPAVPGTPVEVTLSNLKFRFTGGVEENIPNVATVTLPAPPVIAAQNPANFYLGTQDPANIGIFQVNNGSSVVGPFSLTITPIAGQIILGTGVSLAAAAWDAGSSSWEAADNDPTTWLTYEAGQLPAGFIPFAANASTKVLNGHTFALNPNSTTRAVTWTPPAGFVAGFTASRVFLLTIGGIQSNNGQAGQSWAIRIDPPNRAPLITADPNNPNGTGSWTHYFENGIPVALAPFATVIDHDNPTELNGGALYVDIIANPSADDDVLSIANNGNDPGWIGVNGTTVSYGGTAIGTFTTARANGVTSLTVNFNSTGAATLAAAEELIQSIQFHNTSNAPSTRTRTVRFFLDDGDMQAGVGHHLYGAEILKGQSTDAKSGTVVHEFEFNCDTDAYVKSITVTRPDNQTFALTQVQANGVEYEFDRTEGKAEWEYSVESLNAADLDPFQTGKYVVTLTFFNGSTASSDFYFTATGAAGGADLANLTTDPVLTAPVFTNGIANLGAPGNIDYAWTAVDPNATVTLLMEDKENAPDNEHMLPPATTSLQSNLGVVGPWEVEFGFGAGVMNGVNANGIPFSVARFRMKQYQVNVGTHYKIEGTITGDGVTAVGPGCPLVVGILQNVGGNWPWFGELEFMFTGPGPWNYTVWVPNGTYGVQALIDSNRNDHAEVGELFGHYQNGIWPPEGIVVNGANVPGMDFTLAPATMDNVNPDDLPAAAAVNLTAGNDAPVNTGLPVVTGTMVYGQTLTVSTGTWNDELDGGPAPVNFAIQWQRADDVNGTNAADIGGANAGTYTTVAADAGKFVRAKVTATDSGTPAPGATADAFSPWQAVGKAPLSLAGLTANGKQYDGNTGAVIGSYGTLTGIVGADDVTLNSGGATANFADPVAGNGKTVTVGNLALDGTQAGNYSIGNQTTTANITPKPLTLAGLTANNKPYDGGTAATIGNYGTLDGTIGADVVILNSAGANATFDTAAVGNNKTVTVTGLALGGANGGNYSIGNQATTANITQKSLTLTGLTAGNKPYDGNNVATISSYGTLTGKVGAEIVTLDSSGASAVFIDAAVANGKQVTVTGLALAGANAANYSIANHITTANITQKPLTLAGLTADNKTYDGGVAANISNFGALNGAVGAENVALNSTGATASFADKNVGNGKTVTVSNLALSGTNAGNYSIANHTTTANITPKALNLTGLIADNKVYDGGTSAAVNSYGTLDGVVNPDNVTLTTTNATAAFADPTVADGKPVTVSNLALGGDQNANYSIGNQATTASITRKPLILTGLTASDKVYNGNAGATIVDYGTLNGVVNPDTVTLDSSGATAAFADATVANGKTVTVSNLALGGAQAGNYSIGNQATTANITRKQLTLTGLTADNKTYDGGTVATINSYGTLTGIVNPDTVTLVNTGANAAFADALVGNNKNVTVSGLTLNGDQAGNYSIANQATTANITPRQLDVTADNQSRLYGAANPTFTYTPTGFATGDTPANALTGAPTFGTTAVANSPVTGTYPITIAQGTLAANNGNYSFNFVNGTLTVNKAPLNIKADNKSRAYSDNNPGLTVTYTGFVNGENATALTTAPTLTTDARDGNNPPRSPVGATYYTRAANAAATNYDITYTDGTFTIFNTVPDITNAGTVRTIPENTPDAPVAVNANVGAAVAANDPDAGDTKAWSLTDPSGTFAIDPAGGQIQVQTPANLNFEVTPSYTLTVTVTDMVGATDTATVTIGVTNVNERPASANQTVLVTTGTPKTFNLPAITDVDGAGTFTYARVTDPGTGAISQFNTTTGQVIYDPQAAAHGTDTTFDFKVNDGLADSAANYTVTLQIRDNEAPAITAFAPANQPQAINEGAQLDFSVTATDEGHAPQNDGIASVQWTLQRQGGGVLQLGRTDTYNGLGPQTSNFSFTPDYTISNMQQDSVIIVTATVTDGVGVQTPQSWNVTVNDVNQPPSFTHLGNQAVDEDAGPRVVNNWAANFLAGPNAGPNTEDVTGQTLTVTTANSNNALFTPGGQPTVAHPAGTLTYTPADNVFGSAVVTVQAQDNAGTDNGGADTFTATVTITVNPVNDAPVANDNTYSVNEDTLLTVPAPGVLAGDTDQENNPLTAVQVGNPANGTLTYNADGSLTYLPRQNWNGQDTFTYQASDGQAQNPLSNVATVTITVNAVNDAPVNTVPPAGPATTTLEDAPLAFPGTIAVDDVDVNETLNARLQTTLTVTNGTLTLGRTSGLTFNQGSGTGDPTVAFTGSLADVNTALNGLTYTPNQDYNGNDVLTFTTSDQGNTGSGGALDANSTVTITVTPVNDPPSFTAGPNQVVQEDGGSQDSTVSLPLQTVPTWAPAISSGPVNESAQTVQFNVTNDNNALFQQQPAVSPTGTLTYRPALNQHGVATVTVNVQDNGGTTDNGTDTSPNQTFTVTVNPVNDTPIADNRQHNWPGIGQTVVTVTGTDVDYALNPGETSAFAITTPPANGGLVEVPNSQARNGNAVSIQYTYTPNGGTQLLRDTFQFTVTDAARLVSNTATVEITVGPPWYPFATWNSPTPDGWFEIEIYAGTPAAPGQKVLGPYSIQAVNGLVKMTPLEYILAGSQGFQPGAYSYRYRAFDVNTGQFGVWSNLTAFPPVQFNLPGTPTKLDVAPNPGNTGNEFTYSIIAPDAQGYELTINGPNGYNKVLTEFFSPKNDPTQPDFGNLILNEEVTYKVTLTTPGTYTSSVRGFNPLGWSPARLGPDLLVQGAQLAPQPPGQPGLLSPADGAVLTAGNSGTVFQWSAVANAEGYILTVANLATGMMPYAYQDVGNVTRVSNVVLQPGSYMWFVIAYGSGFTQFTWSNPIDFSVVQSLTLPTINNVVQNGNNGLTITWVGGVPATATVQLYYIGAPGWVTLAGLPVTQTGAGQGTVSLGAQALGAGYNFVYVQGYLANGQAGEMSRLFPFLKQ